MINFKNSSNKTKAAFVLTIAMLLILLSNFNTLRNSEATNKNINAIYNDRLVVAGYIFQYAAELSTIKENAIATDKTDALKITALNQSVQHINAINKLYAKTVLTAKEKEYFTSFMTSCNQITKDAQKKEWHKITVQAQNAMQTLESLSKIQIEEGKSKLASANAIHNGNNILGQLQIALLFVLGCISVYLLLVKKTKRDLKIPESPSLN